MRRDQRGATIVEFGMVATLFIAVLLTVVDVGRILFAWNSAAEATRRGARLAVVCDKGAARVLADMQKILPMSAANVRIDWYDGSGNLAPGCDSTNCAGVAVSVAGLKVAPVSPLTLVAGDALEIPAFSTYLPREIMGQDPDSGTVCS